MKGLLLAGGHGTRLRPLTYTGNKHMLPIANKPMLLYGIEHLRNAGIEEVGVVLGPISEGVMEVLGDGSHFGLKITYISQPVPKGLAHAALISEEYMNGEPFVMYLGDNLLRQGVQNFVRVFEQKKADCVIGVSPVSEPSHYGIAELEGGRVRRLIEKPKSSTSNLALVGVYVFGDSIFDAAKAIKPSGRNELEITDAIQVLVSEGKKVEIEHVKGWWKDTGTVEDLLSANRLVLDDVGREINGLVEEDSNVQGRVRVDQGCVIKKGTTVRGPAVLGKGSIISDGAYIGPYTSIGNNVAVKKGEIENSIVMDGCTIDAEERITDSLIGPNSVVIPRPNAGPKGRRLIVGERSTVEL
jgi:glucose-1-phosphate thymidylyltransferase